MPIYEFECSKCGKSFEHLVFTSGSKDEIQCPNCGGKDVCRLFSSFSCGTGSGATNGISQSTGCASKGAFS